MQHNDFPELTLYVTSRCNLLCEGCIMGNFMRKNPKYEMTLEELEEFINITQQSNYILNFIICGGEPLIWRHLKQGLRAIYDSKIAARVLVFSNAMHIKQIDDEVMQYITQLRISKYTCNARNTEILCAKYPDKIRVVDRQVFYKQLTKPLDEVPCLCLNQESLYMNGKVYACAHGASINNGEDELEVTKLYVPLQIGYLEQLPEIRMLQEPYLCTKCSSNISVRNVTEKYNKKEQYNVTLH